LIDRMAANMDTAFRLPDLGEGLVEAEIVGWHVDVGDHVVTGQPLVSVETDKAVVEVPSPRSGHVAARHGDPGDVVAVGTPLVEFTDGPATDKGAIVGEMPEEKAPDEEKPPGASTPRSRAVPAVRQLAGRLGIDLASVNPSGPGATITRSDVEKAAGSATAAGDAIRGVRRAMFRNMTRSGQEVVHATVTDDADVDGWPEGMDATSRLVRALAAGCRAAPALNAWFDTASMTRQLHGRVDVGIAMETDDGLFAPVMRDVGRRDLGDLRLGLERMKKDLDSRTIPHDELVGQTITLSNFGMFGGRYASLVIVPPQVAILGAGRIESRVVATGKGPGVHRILPLSLSFDHRVVTGVEAARFLHAVVEDLETAA
jgi:pyruvate dehydrogenase E2 component (dihydrolipoamide acetyltransferase)